MSRPTHIHWRNSLVAGVVGSIAFYWAAYSWPIILTAGIGSALFSRFISARYSFSLFDGIKNALVIIPILVKKLAIKFKNQVVEHISDSKDILLILTVWYGPTLLVKGLIKLGMDGSLRRLGGDDDALLHLAARAGRPTIVKAFIDRGVKINLKGINNMRPLHYAAWYGRVETVEALIAQRAKINVKDSWLNRTPLHYAAEKGYTKIVEVLIAGGANLYALDYKGQCPLSLAASEGHISTVSRILANLEETERQRFLAERGEHIITQAFQNGRNEMVTLLQNDYGIRLPAHLLNRANDRLNDRQSTHEVSVHESVSQSVLALASCYLPDLSNREKTALRAWYDSALNDPQRSLYKENAQKLMVQLLTQRTIQDYIKQYAAKLQEFCENLQASQCEFLEHNELKVTAAKKALTRLLNDANYRDFTDSRSGVPMLLGLILVYQGVWDNNNACLALSSEQERCEIVVQALYEMQRGYNLDEDDQETDTLSEDKIICEPGHFNKAISALGGGRHDAVNILFVTQEVARFKVQALIKKHYPKVPQAEQERYYGDIQLTRKLPVSIWNNYLKDIVLAELQQEYDSFVKAGMLPQVRLNKAILETVNGILPAHALTVMLPAARLAEEIPEKMQATIIAYYDLCVEEETVMSFEDRLQVMTRASADRFQARHRADELSIEIPSDFEWADRTLMLRNKTQTIARFKQFSSQIKLSTSSTAVLAEEKVRQTELAEALPKI